MSILIIQICSSQTRKIAVRLFYIRTEAVEVKKIHVYTWKGSTNRHVGFLIKAISVFELNGAEQLAILWRG